MANQFRNYLLTINNPVQSDEEFLDYLKALAHIKYATFQREKGLETGTQHFQAYIEFEVGKNFSTIKEYFPTAHIERRKGSKRQARDYCQKTESRMEGHNVYEYGTFVDSGERSDLDDLLAMIDSGSNDRQIQMAYPTQFFRYKKNIAAYRQTMLEARFENVFREIHTTYIYGTTETGKTRYVMEKYGYENVCRITSNDSGAFDNYKGQDIIIFEEFRNSFKIEEMLNYLDGYPLMLPSRYNNKVACYTKVYIVSNWTLQEQYKNIQVSHPTTWQAFLRRIKTVYNFDISKDTPVNKLTGTKKSLAQLIPLSDEEASELPF